MRRQVLVLLVLAGTLMGDAQPGWCPFADPTPGADIHVPRGAPPSTMPPPPPMVSYPSFDRSRDVAPMTSRSGDAQSPARVRPSLSRDGAAPGTPPTAPWAWPDNPLLTTSAALLLVLLGGLPLLWIWKAATNPTLPADLVNRRWRGWTQRTPR